MGQGSLRAPGAPGTGPAGTSGSTRCVRGRGTPARGRAGHAHRPGFGRAGPTAARDDSPEEPAQAGRATLRRAPGGRREEPGRGPGRAMARHRDVARASTGHPMRRASHWRPRTAACTGSLRSCRERPRRRLRPAHVHLAQVDLAQNSSRTSLSPTQFEPGQDPARSNRPCEPRDHGSAGRFPLHPKL